MIVSYKPSAVMLTMAMPSFDHPNCRCVLPQTIDLAGDDWCADAGRFVPSREHRAEARRALVSATRGSVVA